MSSKRQPNGNSLLNRPFQIVALLHVLGIATVGCNLVHTDAPDADMLALQAQEAPPAINKKTNAKEQRISNPQAREIRFDGQEFVLGGGDCRSIRVAELRELTTELRKRGRYRSANETLRLHHRSASRWVMESIGSARVAGFRWVANTLDQRSGVALHSQLCDAAAANPSAAKAFHAARRQYLTALTNGVVDARGLESLAQSVTQLNAHLANLELERLRAMGEITAGQTATAAARLVGTAKMAANAGSLDQSAQLWLLASETFLRAENLDSAGNAWQHAVHAQLTAMTQQNRGQAGLAPLDTIFWEQADLLRRPGLEFPQEVALAMNDWKLRIGIGADLPMTPAASVWSAVAAFQLTMGQPHLATLSIKRAEVKASEWAKPWLRIALARSVAAQAQLQVATTILSSLSKHSDPRVRAASLATLGSIKVQAGAYEQGSRFLIQSLTMDGAEQWPGRLAAEADLANVRLIVGDIEDARVALHAVQQKLALRGRWQSLVHSLENEAQILELENNRAASKQIRNRILSLERQGA